MKYLILTDIFGLTPWVDSLKTKLEALGHNVLVLDPYQGEYLNLTDETAAYAAFCEASSHDGYYQSALILAKTHLPDTLIGFSAGASAAWRIASNKGLNFKSIHCYYPSQIRYYHDLSPKYPCQLILPNYEGSFDVAAMGEYLQGRTHLEIEMSQYGHGFMNPLSAHYNEKAKALALKLLLSIASLQ